MIKIGNKILGKKYPCLVIAEISANHDGDFNRMKRLIKSAKKAGADLIKIQSYTADSLTLNSKKKDFIINNSSPWKKNQYFWNLYKKAETPIGWHGKIFNYAKKEGIGIFSSPFDVSAVDMLEKLKCPAYKIASAEINHIPLIERIAKTKKPIIFSIGLANLEEIKTAIKIIKKYKNNKIIILQCVSSYPAPLNEQNIKAIPLIEKKFKVLAGLSDHTTNSISSLAAVALGASVIEKHFNLSDKRKTVDSFFSTNEKKFKILVEEIRSVEKVLGYSKIQISKSSMKNIHSKRSIYISSKIKKGEKINKENIKVVRPSFGLNPKFYNYVLGKKVNKNLFYGDRLSLSHIKK